MKISKKDVIEYFLIKKEGTARDVAEYLIDKYKMVGNINYKKLYQNIFYYIKALEEEGSLKRKKWLGAWVFEFQNRAFI
jgi:uncharacterized protein YpiB (UPF0302 family)